MNLALFIATTGSLHGHPFTSAPARCCNNNVMFLAHCQQLEGSVEKLQARTRRRDEISHVPHSQEHTIHKSTHAVLHNNTMPRRRRRRPRRENMQPTEWTDQQQNDPHIEILNWLGVNLSNVLVLTFT